MKNIHVTAAQRLDNVTFTGVLDGNGYSVSHTSTMDGCEPLMYINRGTIRNLHKGKSHTAAVRLSDPICRYNYGTITHCASNAGTRKGRKTGPFATYNYGLIENCHSMVNLGEAQTDGGAIVYTNGSGGIIRNCVTDCLFEGLLLRSTVLGTAAYENLSGAQVDTFFAQESAGAIGGWNSDFCIKNSGTVKNAVLMSWGRTPERFPGLDFEEHWCHSEYSRVMLKGFKTSGYFG